MAKTTMTNDGRLMDNEINFMNELRIASYELRVGANDGNSEFGRENICSCGRFLIYREIFVSFLQIRSLFKRIRNGEVIK